VDKVLLSSRTFNLNDQQAFADFSGDINPIHLSDVYARKTPPGQVIVHGINSLLWALDSFQQCSYNITYQMSVRFLQPIQLNETIYCYYIAKDKIIEISNASVVFLRIKLSGDVYRPACEGRESIYSHQLSKLQIVELDFNQIESSQLLNFFQTADPNYVDELYPALLEHIGGSLICQIACLSSVVGMQVPGLHSIFASASLDLQESSSKNSIQIVKTDRRFGLVDLKVQSSGIQSKLRTIVRPKPTQSLSLDDISKKISKHVSKRFAVGENVLIIGGSRGLGCYVVKILALLGASVTFTYSKGEKDAQLLKDELSNSNISVDFLHFDIKNPDVSSLFVNHPDYIFYFPTPKIFVKRSKCFEEKLYDDFKLFYVDGFQSILDQCFANSVKGVFYPSTVAIEESAKDLPEYIKAKLEGEDLSDQFNGSNKATVFVSRLPRTLTDQTTTNLSIINEDPFDVLMPILQEFFDGYSVVN